MLDRLVVWMDDGGQLQLSTVTQLSTDRDVREPDVEFGTFRLSSLLGLKPMFDKTLIKKNFEENRLSEEQLKAVGLKVHTPEEKFLINPCAWNVQSESEETKAA